MTDADVRGYRLEVYRDPDDGSWVAEVPDLPGCVAGGDTADEAVEQVADSIEAWIDAAKASKRAVPLPRSVDEEHSGRFVLRLSRRLHAQLARVARREGVSLNAYCSMALAESVGAAEAQQAFVAKPFTFIESEDYLQLLKPPASVLDNTSIYKVGQSGEAVMIGAGSAGMALIRTIHGGTTAKGATQ